MKTKYIIGTCEINAVLTTSPCWIKSIRHNTYKSIIQSPLVVGITSKKIFYTRGRLSIEVRRAVDIEVSVSGKAKDV